MTLLTQQTINTELNPKSNLTKCRNETNVFFKTGWKHQETNQPIEIDSFTPMTTLIQKLKEVTKVNYTERQIADGKQFYQTVNKSLINKGKYCQNWVVDY